MARPFSIPAIPALAVGESYVVEYPETANVKDSVAEVTRKVSGYAKRCKAADGTPAPKAFSVASTINGVRVTRLPDPQP